MTTSDDTAAATVFQTPDDLLGAVGLRLGTTAWATVDAADVQRFVDATATPDAGGGVPTLMVLALTNRLLPELLQVPGASNGVNYGTGSVRFPAEVRPGDRVRASARLAEAVEVPGGVQTAVEITVEVARSGEAACVVESLSRWMRCPGPAGWSS